MDRIAILIPEMEIKPKFVLFDSKTGEERALTELEQQVLDSCLASEEKYREVKRRIDSWPVKGKYRSVIDYKGGSYANEQGKRYVVFTLGADRLDVLDIKSFIDHEQKALSSTGAIVGFFERGVNSIVVDCVVYRRRV